MALLLTNLKTEKAATCNTRIIINMEHPGLSVREIKETLTIDEMQSKISDVNSRLNFSYRTGNQQLINQLNMVLETYTRAYQETLNEMFGNDKDDPNKGIIDIS